MRGRERLNNRDNKNVILNDGMAPHNRPIVPSASLERARNPLSFVYMHYASSQQNLQIKISLLVLLV